MRKLRDVLLRMLCLVSVLTAGVTAANPSAHAAAPDRWGFAVVDVTSGVPSLSHEAGSWPTGSTVTVAAIATGQVFVRFPQIGIPFGGVVHVTAITQEPKWCQVQQWGPWGADEGVAVQCYRYGGTPEFTSFSVVFSESSGRLNAPQAFGYIHSEPVSGGDPVASSYNSMGVTNRVTRVAPGLWQVTLPGLGSAAQTGGFQVTAVNAVRPARCKPASWTPSTTAHTLYVICHDATTTRIDTGWTLTYQRERAITGGALPPTTFAYTFDKLPTTPGPYSPTPAAINYNSLASTNDIRTAGPGLRLVTFPAVGSLPDNVQATAYGVNPEYCNLLATWTTTGGTATVHDACYNGLTRSDQSSFVTYVSAR
ncbi:hypothetical protein [Sphaerisporangium aureirubrum]|uniref:Uncharacterized protein n=1 Tax=Sphaerisporangium aureirubrum TaxID=1544736 RepID=A0ABW1NA17_9ACTN